MVPAHRGERIRGTTRARRVLPRLSPRDPCSDWRSRRSGRSARRSSCRTSRSSARWSCCTGLPLENIDESHGAAKRRAPRRVPGELLLPRAVQRVAVPARDAADVLVGAIGPVGLGERRADVVRNARPERRRPAHAGASRGGVAPGREGRRALVLASARSSDPRAYAGYWLGRTGDALRPFHAQDAWFRTFEFSVVTLGWAFAPRIRGIGDARGIYWTTDSSSRRSSLVPLAMRWRRDPGTYLVYAAMAIGGPDPTRCRNGRCCPLRACSSSCSRRSGRWRRWCATAGSW